MRLLFGCLLVLVAGSYVHGQQSVGQGIALTPELVEAYREYAVARQRLIRYRQVELPANRQSVSDAIDQTRWEIAVLNRRLRDYGPALRLGEYSPVRTAAEGDFLTRNLAAQRLRQLRDDEIALMRFSGAADELYQYDLLRAVLQVRAARTLAEQ